MPEKVDKVTTVTEDEVTQACDSTIISRTVDWEQLPEWQKDNRFILSGYRRATQSYRGAIYSLGYIHNQTGNILSHLLAVPAMVLTAGVWYSTSLAIHLPIDDGILSIFIIGATLCFLLSSAFHTFACHSKAVEDYWVRLDFVGIIVLTATTFVAGEYYIFYCERVRIAVHMTTTMTLATSAIMVLLTPRFQGQKYRVFRLTCFCSMGMSGFIPIIDSLAHNGWQHSKRYSMVYYLVEMLLEIVGVAAYATRIPERFTPGRFDIWGHSHQYFHLFAVAAALVHLAGLANAVKNTRSIRRCTGPWR